jgi:hypothetical protein
MKTKRPAMRDARILVGRERRGRGGQWNKVDSERRGVGLGSAERLCTLRREAGRERRLAAGAHCTRWKIEAGIGMLSRVASAMAAGGAMTAANCGDREGDERVEARK